MENPNEFQSMIEGVFHGFHIVLLILFLGALFLAIRMGPERRRRRKDRDPRR